MRSLKLLLLICYCLQSLKAQLIVSPQSVISVNKTAKAVYVNISRVANLNADEVFKFNLSKISALESLLDVALSPFSSTFFSLISQTLSNDAIDVVEGLTSFKDIVDGKIYMVAVLTSFIQIFEYEGVSFRTIQKIKNVFGRNPSSFYVDNQLFLAVPNEQMVNSQGAVTYIANSIIFKWSSKLFVFFQNISSTGARSVTYFQNATGTHFLVFANFWNAGSKTRANSAIFSFDKNSNLFVLYQNIPTIGANSITHFISGEGKSVLLIANFYDSVTFSYKLQTQYSVYIQSTSGFFQVAINNNITTYGATTWEVVKIGADIYCAVANYQETSSNYYVSSGSIVYKWSNLDNSLIPFQSFSDLAIFDWVSFKLQGVDCLAYSTNSKTSGESVMMIYAYDKKSNKFGYLDMLKSLNIKSTEALVIDGKTILATFSNKPNRNNELWQVISN